MEKMKLKSTNPASRSCTIVLITLIVIFLDISSFKCHDRMMMEIGQRRARKSRNSDMVAPYERGQDRKSHHLTVNPNDDKEIIRKES